jgi:hypothetical protein
MVIIYEEFRVTAKYWLGHLEFLLGIYVYTVNKTKIIALSADFMKG